MFAFAVRLGRTEAQAAPMDEDKLLELASQQLLAQLEESSRKDTGRVLQMTEPFGSFTGNKRWKFVNTMADGAAWAAPGLTTVDATSVKLAKARIMASTEGKECIIAGRVSSDPQPAMSNNQRQAASTSRPASSRRPSNKVNPEPPPKSTRATVRWATLSNRLDQAVEKVRYAPYPAPAPSGPPWLESGNSIAGTPGTPGTVPGTVAGTPGTVPGTPGTIPGRPGTPGTVPGTPGTIPGRPGTPGTVPGTVTVTPSTVPGTPSSAEGGGDPYGEIVLGPRSLNHEEEECLDAVLEGPSKGNSFMGPDRRLGMPPLVVDASDRWATSLNAGRPLSAQPRRMSSRLDLVSRRPQSAQARLFYAPSFTRNPYLQPPQADKPPHFRSHRSFRPHNPDKDPREPPTLPGTGPPKGLGSSMLPLPTPPHASPGFASQPLPPKETRTPLSDTHTLTRKDLGPSMPPLPTLPPGSASQPLPSETPTPMSDPHNRTPKGFNPEGALLTLTPSDGQREWSTPLQPYAMMALPQKTTALLQPHGMTALPTRNRRLPPLDLTQKDGHQPDPTLHVQKQKDDPQSDPTLHIAENASTLLCTDEGEFPSHVKMSPRKLAKLDNEQSGLLNDGADPSDPADRAATADRATKGSVHGVNSTAGQFGLHVANSSTFEAVNPQEPQGGRDAVDCTAYGGRDAVKSTAYGGRDAVNSTTYGGRDEADRTSYGGRDAADRTAYGGSDAADMSTTSKAADPQEPQQRVEVVAVAGVKRKCNPLKPSNYMSEAFYLLEGEDLVSMVRQKVSLLTDDLWAMVEEVNRACEWIQTVSLDADGHIERLLAGKEALDAAERQAKGLSVAMNFAKEQERVRRKRAADAQTAILAERQADSLGAALRFSEHARLLRQQHAADQERAQAHANSLALAMQFSTRAKQERENQATAVEVEKKSGSYAAHLGVAMRFAKQTNKRDEQAPLAADVEKLGSYVAHLGVAMRFAKQTHKREEQAPMAANLENLSHPTPLQISKTEGREVGGHTGLEDSNRILEDLKAFQCRPILPPRKQKGTGQSGRATPARGWNHRRRALEQFYNSVDRRGEF
eukprot:gene12335-15511_t